jgi:quercetin dioxygenase-like cupin family protein
MSNFANLEDVPPFEVWGDLVRARRIQGERITIGVIELAPGGIVPEHRHEAEQLGMVIEGTVRFTIDDETCELGPGGTWRIPSNHPHMVEAGPNGAVCLDAFNPVRNDWDIYPLLEPQATVWPRRD